MSIGGLTYLNLQQEVLEFQFSESKYRPLVKRWLNDAQRIVVRQSEIRTQQERVAYETEPGVGELELPSDFARLIDFYQEDGPLTQLSLPEYDGLCESSGRPRLYAVSGSDLLLYPVPDRAYELALRYWRLPQDMVSDSDLPEIPVQYHRILPSYPLKKAYARENDYAASQFWANEWETELLKLRGEVQSDAFDGPRQVGGTYGREAPLVQWR